MGSAIKIQTATGALSFFQLEGLGPFVNPITVVAKNSLTFPFFCWDVHTWYKEKSQNSGPHTAHGPAGAECRMRTANFNSSVKQHSRDNTGERNLWSRKKICNAWKWTIVVCALFDVQDWGLLPKAEKLPQTEQSRYSLHIGSCTGQESHSNSVGILRP